MKQYLDLCGRIIKEGSWVENYRTNTRCLTVINADLEYDVQNNEFPLVTTRKAFWKPAVAEMLGYIRGYSSADNFRKLGTKTWDANANLNNAWLANPHRKGEDDMGRVYGVQGREWQKPGIGLTSNNQTVDQFKKVINDLTSGVDDRGEIVTFWNPGEFDQGCLRPCMHSHQFSVLDGILYLNSTQRSCDVPLGLTFNMVQVYFLLAVVAQITGLTPGKAYHKIVNAHIYEDQLDLMKNVQLQRSPWSSPQFTVSPVIQTLEDLETWVTVDDFWVDNYQHHRGIKYPFSV